MIGRRPLFFAPLLALSAACTKAELPQRNILLITVDTLRADHLGAYGYSKPTSPSIDALFAESVVFDDAQSSSSWTLPSFASMFTSLHSSAHGCFGYRDKLDGSFVTIAETLSSRGWRTAGIISHVFLRDKHGLPQGIDDFDQSLVQTIKESHQAISSPHVSDRAIERLESFAAADDDGPWFLWLHYFDPHVSYRRHEGISFRFGKTPIDRYDGEIAFTDGHIGRVLDRLAALGLADDTIVGFLSDHGEEFEEHGRKGHGKSLHEEVLRVPFALRVPGSPPRRVETTVHLVDLSPTLLELAGEAWPATAPRHGRSLAPAVRGERLPDAESLGELRLELRKDATLTSLIVGSWKLIEERARPPATEVRHRLYDRRDDRAERTDVADQFPEVTTRMKKRLAAATKRAAQTSHGSVAADLDATDLENLESLGYLSDDDEK